MTIQQIDQIIAKLKQDIEDKVFNGICQRAVEVEYGEFYATHGAPKVRLLENEVVRRLERKGYRNAGSAFVFDKTPSGQQERINFMEQWRDEIIEGLTESDGPNSELYP